MAPTNERSLEKLATPSVAPEGAQLFHPLGAAGLLAEARNLPARDDSQLLSGMQSNQAMMEKMGFQAQQLHDRMSVDFPAEKNAFSTGKHLASNIRAEHGPDKESIQTDFQKHDVRGIFVHGYREGKENAYRELGTFETLQSKLNDMSGGRGQLLTDSQSAAGTIKDMNPGAGINKDQLSAKPERAQANSVENATRLALMMGDLTNKPQGAQPAEQFGRLIKMMDKSLNSPPPADSNQKHNDQNKSLEFTHNQYDAVNAKNRDSTEQHIFNSYMANLAGSVIDRLMHGEHQSEKHAHARLNGSSAERGDEIADRRIANDKAQQDERAAGARNRQEADLAAHRHSEKENNIKDQERSQDKQTRADAGKNAANVDADAAGRQQRGDQVVHDPAANQESADSSDSVTRALSDLTGLLMQIGDTAKEKWKLQPILKLKMLMKMRTQIMQKFRLMWKAKNKLLDKLKLKKREKAKAKLKVVASRRQKQNNQRRSELQRSENRRAESRRQRESQREERQPTDRGDVQRQDRQRLEARRTDMRQTDSKVANLDAARVLRQSVVSRSEAAPQHHVTEVTCIGRPTHGLKQSLFGPMNCGNPTGVAKIPQLTDASLGVSTAVTTTARRA